MVMLKGGGEGEAGGEAPVGVEPVVEEGDVGALGGVGDAEAGVGEGGGVVEVEVGAGVPLQGGGEAEGAVGVVDEVALLRQGGAVLIVGEGEAGCEREARQEAGGGECV